MEQPEDMASLSEFDSLAGSIPATKVEITVSCRNLLDKDMFSKSDPLCVMYTQGMENKQWREFGRTEVIDNTLNPDFVRKFIVDYFFEEKQNLRFDLYDVDSKSPDLSKHDFLGQAFCTLGEIVGSPGSRLEKPLTIGAFSLNSRTGKPMPAVSNGGLWMESLRTTGLEASGGVPGKKCGTIILSAEELSNCRDVATMQFCANKLDKKDFFGKSDPFLVFYRSNEDGTFTICHKTEVMKNTLNPVWQTFSIPVRALCNGDYDRTIKVEVYDWDRDGSHDFIGEFTTSYRELARGQSQFNIYEVVNPKKKMKKKKYVNSGTVTLLSFAVESECTFLDYIKGGTQINFTVAIDFTASNGNPSQSTSLHYMSPYQLNAYALALTAVGEIIQHYDSDKMFPALGFGAKLPPDGRVSHEFPLNGNQENPSCCGIDGILEAYHRSLRTVQLYGPTNFAPVVTHVARNAAAVQDGSQYSVLLIITDGVISDMAQTKEAIVNAAKLPMSIIIVGVGQAEFDAMVELDGDDVRISSRGKLAERDIVQFVPFRDYVDRTGNHVLSMARLARDVLAEIPDQLVSYMKAQGIRPRPPPAAPTHSPSQSPARTPPASPLHTHI
ncbi:copine-5 isoform X2 [Pongo pygmaeus]|uniref:copine-5 isoform X5 n=1 Tax=Pan troglodytes TaxID=9598 RepID=UPI000020DC1F|nr:copine-5 isoform X6 [Pan troglodytes]XP_011929940.1 PREDICTED: copine-5 isoform X2 [Cercocebus atys]XP_028703450.1 copine-5 isoform X2 [Macaca mulatta]XP_054347625.1 copine-5 isoform X2 [Pongo pygmaeus]XP_054969522.1 copine-5 isoform X5 [Pan paniscus]XP_055246283.1 copine-5 isoform X5 [Gorilla gorilla gorilla]